MPVQLSHKADFLVAELPSELTIFNVREVHQALLPFRQSDSEKLILDITSLDELDSAGVQLLLWVITQVKQPAQIILSYGENPLVQRLTELYAIAWPLQFEQ